MKNGKILYQNYLKFGIPHCFLKTFAASGGSHPRDRLRSDHIYTPSLDGRRSPRKILAGANGYIEYQ